MDNATLARNLRASADLLDPPIKPVTLPRGDLSLTEAMRLLSQVTRKPFYVGLKVWNYSHREEASPEWEVYSEEAGATESSKTLRASVEKMLAKIDEHNNPVPETPPAEVMANAEEVIAASTEVPF